MNRRIAIYLLQMVKHERKGEVMMFANVHALCYIFHVFLSRQSILGDDSFNALSTNSILLENFNLKYMIFVCRIY
jgi:hypothetical protein